MSERAKKLIEMMIHDGIRSTPLSTKEQSQFVKAMDSIIRGVARGFKIRRPDRDTWGVITPDAKTASALASALRKNFRASNFGGNWRDDTNFSDKIEVTTVSPGFHSDDYGVVITTPFW